MKRKVTTDALDTLGRIITENEKRDAIHLAVENVIAGENLERGNYVSFDSGKAYWCLSDDPASVGIVDPFLRCQVKKGDRFWLVVKPREITSLRHVWTHPAFDDVEDQEVQVDVSGICQEVGKSKEWLEGFAQSRPISLGLIMRYAENWVIYGDVASLGVIDFGEVPKEFWHHYQIVTGQNVDEDKQENFFSCNC